MPYRDEGDDWDEPDLDDSEFPDEADTDPDDDDVPTAPCPYCGREIAEEAEVCPGCGSFISREDAPPARRPRWLALGVFLCAVILLVWIFGLLKVVRLSR